MPTATLAARSALDPLRDRQPMLLGIFAINAKRSFVVSDAPTSFTLSWAHSAAIARLAEEAGIDLLMPVSRWRGFGGPSDYHGETYETLTYMAAIAATTRTILPLVTLHLPLVHPVYAAKAIATLDHISGGRTGINAVMGWYAKELGMFGLAPHAPEDRYAYGTEWLELVERLWSEVAPFDHKGRFFDLPDCESRPAPVQARPVIVSAAVSPQGVEFAARHADLSFASFRDIAQITDHCARLKARSLALRGREVGVLTIALILCRETEAEARRAYAQLRDCADLEAATHLARSSGADPDAMEAHARDAMLRDLAMSPGSAVIVGNPEQVATRIGELKAAGVGGLLIGLHDYLQELPFFRDRVLPLLEQAGTRAPRATVMVAGGD